MDVAQIVLAIENAEMRIEKCVKAIESGGIGRNILAVEQGNTIVRKGIAGMEAKT